MFSLDNVLDELYPRRKPSPWQSRLLRGLLHEQEFQDFAARHQHLKGLDMVEQVLEHLQIRCDIAERDLEQIPARGPVVIVANHPTGTADGLALLYALSRIRRDVKIVANRILTHLQPLASLFIPVDNLNNRTQRDAIDRIHQHLANGGVLIFFPAGEVSRLTGRGIEDKAWNTGFLKAARKQRATIVPVHIRGHNSPWFYASALISPTLAMLLLIREMFRQRGARLTIRVGERIPWRDSHSNTPLHDLARQFRQQTLALGKGQKGPLTSECAIARPEDRARLRQALAECECLGKTPDGKIIWLWQRNGAEEAPILRELGRLREIAFRAVGEGSGRRRDIDRYDDDYLHLILWDDVDLEIVGAYRFTPTAGRDPSSLYSHSLFHYDAAMAPVLQQGIELGRSFIQPRYWGKRGLDYLWIGIGAWLARHPDYRYLFGPVSISGGLPQGARELLVAFYRRWFPADSPRAASRRPWPSSLPETLQQFAGLDYHEDLARLKSLLGNLGCGIPPLYKQYSELCEPGGVQFMDFGSDPAFNDCIDGLVVVDLTRLKTSRYQRYIAVHHPAQHDAPAL